MESGVAKFCARGAHELFAGNIDDTHTHRKRHEHARHPRRPRSAFRSCPELPNTRCRRARGPFAVGVVVFVSSPRGAFQHGRDTQTPRRVVVCLVCVGVWVCHARSPNPSHSPVRDGQKFTKPDPGTPNALTAWESFCAISSHTHTERQSSFEAEATATANRSEMCRCVCVCLCLRLFAPGYRRE